MQNNVLVTGMPRAGTSITMRILQKLGYTRLGNKHIKHCAPEFNPDGYEELEEEQYLPAMQQLKDGNGYCVKVFGSFINMLPSSAIDKVVFCTRDIEQAISSAQKMFIGTKHLTWAGQHHLFNGTVQEAYAAVTNSIINSRKWLKFNKKDCFTSKLEYLKENPTEVINNLVTYLGEGDNIESAIALVRS